MINTFQIFANTFHSASLRGRGYLITFWITYLNHTRKGNWTSKEAVQFYGFYVASLWWCIVHWCKETHLIYGGGGKHIYLLVITFVLLGPLLWDFAAEFLPKILFKWYLEWLCFWASTLWSCNGEDHWWSQISNDTQNVPSWKSCGHSSMKRFPLHPWQERSLLCKWGDTKFRFEWLITCLQTRKKRVKRLVRGRNTSTLV